MELINEVGNIRAYYDEIETDKKGEFRKFIVLGQTSGEKQLRRDKKGNLEYTDNEKVQFYNFDNLDSMIKALNSVRKRFPNIDIKNIKEDGLKK